MIFHQSLSSFRQRMIKRTNWERKIMNRLSEWICGWHMTVLTGLLVAPVFVSTADLLFQPPKHNSNLIIPIQYPQRYIQFYRQHTDNAKNLETLNSRSVLSSHDDLMHNTMLNAEKPVDEIHKMHRIEQLQQKQELTVYNDDQQPVLDAKNKTAFFDEDDGNNVLRPHGQPGNVLSTQFIDNGNAAMVKRNPTMRFNRYKRNATKPMSFAEHLINKLSATNAAVSFSQSAAPAFWFPFDVKGTIYDHSVDGKLKNKIKNIRSIYPQHSHVIIINGPTRIYGDGIESKFPPFLEFFVQRIQKYFSVYKYEDLSRPPLASQMSPEKIVQTV